MTRSGCRDDNSSRAVQRNKFMIRPSCVEDSLELLNEGCCQADTDAASGQSERSRPHCPRSDRLCSSEQERRLQSGNNVTAKIQNEEDNPSDQQHLTLAGKQLEYDCTLPVFTTSRVPGVRVDTLTRVKTPTARWKLGKTTYSESASSAVAVERQQRRDFQQGLAVSIRERRPWTRRRTCLLQDSTGTEKEQRRLHQTRRLVNQYVRVCVEMCPLPTRHTAKRSGDSCEARARLDETSRVQMTPQLWRDCSPEAEAENEARSHPHAGPQREQTTAGWRREREQPERPSSGQLPRSTRGGGEWCLLEQQPVRGPRAARGSVRQERKRQRSDRGSRWNERRMKRATRSGQKSSGPTAGSRRRAGPTAGERAVLQLVRKIIANCRQERRFRRVEARDHGAGEANPERDQDQVPHNKHATGTATKVVSWTGQSLRNDRRQWSR